MRRAGVLACVFPDVSCVSTRGMPLSLASLRIVEIYGSRSVEERRLGEERLLRESGNQRETR